MSRIGKSTLLEHNNARLHTFLVILQKLLELNWHVLIHPSCSPDIASSDHHLFQALQYFLTGKNFTSDDNVKTNLKRFLAGKKQPFYDRGVIK